MKNFTNVKKTLKDNNIVSIRADKGNTIVLIHNDTYIDKVNNFLNDNEFNQLKKDPTPNYNEITKKTLDNCKGILNSQLIYKLKNMNPSAPKLTGYPKIHKNCKGILCQRKRI